MSPIAKLAPCLDTPVGRGNVTDPSSVAEILANETATSSKVLAPRWYEVIMIDSTIAVGAGPFRWGGDELTIAALDDWATELSRKAKPGTAAFANAVHVFIVVHFLGERWYYNHAYLNSPASSPLHPHFDPDGRAAVYSMRMLNLAEMLLNLQGVEGFQTCLDHMTLDQIESALSELQIGMMLYQDQIHFRYLDPVTVRGKSPDIEIILRDGVSALADIKCKYEDTEVREVTLINTLKKALKQLPKGRPSLIFVKVPQEWTFEAGDAVMLPIPVVNATSRFLRNTTRVAKVVFYIFHLARHPAGMLNRHAIREVNNPRNPDDSPWNQPLFPLTHSGFNWITMPSLIDRWTEQFGWG